MMEAKNNDDSKLLDGEHAAFWRSSNYEEPTWVSLAWILVPLLIAGSLIYVVVG